jgi:GNAT superfamily N-acetyltransferase
VQLEGLIFTRLSDHTDVSGFDCGDSDINEFFRIDARNYEREKLATTFMFVNEEGQAVIFFSISNDCIKDLGDQHGFNNNIWNRLHRKSSIPNTKRIRQYPAVKIGRLGISINYQKTGIAYELMDFIKGWLLTDHKPAFRFLILDAYNKERQKKFYTRNGFEFLLSDDEQDETRIMYYDMIKFN